MYTYRCVPIHLSKRLEANYAKALCTTEWCTSVYVRTAHTCSCVRVRPCESSTQYHFYSVNAFDCRMRFGRQHLWQALDWAAITELKPMVEVEISNGTDFNGLFWRGFSALHAKQSIPMEFLKQTQNMLWRHWFCVDENEFGRKKCWAVREEVDVLRMQWVLMEKMRWHEHIQYWLACIFGQTLLFPAKWILSDRKHLQFVI